MVHLFVGGSPGVLFLETVGDDAFMDRDLECVAVAAGDQDQCIDVLLVGTRSDLPGTLGSRSLVTTAIAARTRLSLLTVNSSPILEGIDDAVNAVLWASERDAESQARH